MKNSRWAARGFVATAIALIGPLFFYSTILAITMGKAGNRGTPLEPQVLSFKYVTGTVNASAVIASVRSGQTTIADLLSRASGVCGFTADFSSRTPPRVFINGTPGQIGFNVNLISAEPVSLTTPNQSCFDELSEFEINIGGRLEALALGNQTSLTNGRVKLVDGREFTTSEFFQAQINRFDPANRRSEGSFRFINRLSRASNMVLIVEGSYFLTP
jgi:hypothetical protein